MSGWRCGVLAGVVGLAVILVTGAAAGSVPNPCTLVAAAKVSATVKSKVTMTGKLSTRPDGKVKQTLCTYTNGAAILEIGVAPHQVSGGSGGPPGMVLTHPSGLGTGATFAYGTNPKYKFATALFTKGNIDALVYSNGTYANAGIVALAHLVYAALP